MPTATTTTREQQIEASRQRSLAQRQFAAQRAASALTEFSGKMNPDNRAAALEAIRSLSSYYGGKLPDDEVRMAAKYLAGSPTFTEVVALKAAAQKVATWCETESTRGHDDAAPSETQPSNLEPQPDAEEPLDDDEPNDDEPNDD